jgi:predicted site-specific integrase-resolvase
MCAYAARMKEKDITERATLDGLLDKRGLAYRAQISTRTVDTWMKKGLIPFLKIGGKTVRFRWGDVVAKLNEHRIN